jgi:hypothetical protein
VGLVAAERGVLFAHLGQALARKAPRRAHQGGPEPPMHECDLSVDHAAGEDLGGVGDFIERAEKSPGLGGAPTSFP